MWTLLLPPNVLWSGDAKMNRVLIPLAVASIVALGSARPSQPQDGEMAGYLLVPCERVPESFSAGFSMYVAAWPLLKTYPGHRFQSGLFGTWMFAQHEGPPPEDAYSDVEGGLGWWRDTRFPTETPKFIMGGVAPQFGAIANGPAHGIGTWEEPRGLYGVAQLSQHVLFPIDGLNIRQGTCGELFGYGYLPLPLTPAKDRTAGAEVPTGDQCWTLFLNTDTFRGPLAFFLPYFWSRSTIDEPRLAGKLLDTRPTDPNRALQMETQYIPAVQASDAAGQQWARIAPTMFPRGADGHTVGVHKVMSFDRSALWDDAKAWFDGGPECTGKIGGREGHGIVVHQFPGHGGATWRIYLGSTPKEERAEIAWKSFATPQAPDPETFGYRWGETVTEADGLPAIELPQFYKLETGEKKSQWLPVKPEDVPAETGLAAVEFGRAREPLQPPYTTPDDPDSCWKKPGPAAGPFKARLGDGSTVIYYWYRFADQPALLNADLTESDRERMQVIAEMIHRNWTPERDYLPPPDTGAVAELDPAQLVTPPPGLEVGYVPIAVWQGFEE